MNAAEWILAVVAWLALWLSVGYWVVGPLMSGHKAFTSPAAAARGERRRDR